MTQMTTKIIIRNILVFAKLNRKILGDKGTLESVLKQLDNLEKEIKG